MLSRISKTILFYFAYLPLFIILCINNGNLYSVWTYLIILVIIAIGLITTTQLFRVIGTVAPKKEKLEINAAKNSEYLSFLVTYLIPFFLSLSNPNQVISFILLFIMVYYLFLDTSMFCVNPLLKIVYKYNIYDVTISNKSFFLLSKSSHSNQTKTLNVKCLSDNLLIEEQS